ncbi:hypothetical protein [Nocardia brasiliensis]|uniref:hypothetical protein n=1 Tax=Nocardia brasiliensis TaxID=37326 RepID=UPI0033D24981
MTDTGKTLDDLNTVLKQFSVKIDEIRNTPEDVDEAFQFATIAAAANEGALLIPVPGVGSVVGAAYGALTEDSLTGVMQDNKDKIKDSIRKVLEELAQAIDGLRAPVAFIHTVGEWLKTKSQISEARNNYLLNGNLTGQWLGASAVAYGNAATIQQTAMESAMSVCDTANSALRESADGAWKFYSAIIEDITEYLTKFAAAMLKIASFVAMPVGVSDAIDFGAKLVEKVGKHGLALGAVLIKQQGILDALTVATTSPAGINNGKWPQSASTDFDAQTPDKDKWDPR